MMMATDKFREADANLIFSRQFMPPKIKENFSCIVIGAEPEFRVGMVKSFHGFENFKVIAEAVILDDMLEKLDNITPDFAVIHITIGGINPLNTLGQLREHFPKIFILVTSDYNVPDLVRRMLLAGANGYLMRSSIDTYLEEALDFIVAGKVYIDNILYTAFLSSIMQIDTDSSEMELGSLTDKEFTVFIYLGQGLGRKYISRRTGLSVSSVAVYLKRIRDRLKLAGNDELKKYAMKWVKTFL